MKEKKDSIQANNVLYFHLKLFKYTFVATLISVLFVTSLLCTIPKDTGSSVEVPIFKNVYKDVRMRNIKSEQQIQRIHRIKKVCADFKIPFSTPHPRHFLTDHHHKLMYCWIHKVASTSWIALFSSLANRTWVQKYYREIKVLSAKNDDEWRSMSLDRSYVKFLVVRHPFTRLVSAYRDRIEDNSRFTSQAWLYAPQILSQRKLKKYEIFQEGNKKLVIIPTFEEFINWLISTPPNRYDVHWNRYHDHCLPCTVQYDAILQLETLDGSDKEYLMNITGLKHMNVQVGHLQQTAKGLTTVDISCQYFKKLTLQQVKALHEIYELDFQMFNYSPELFYNCSNQSQIYQETRSSFDVLRQPFLTSV